MANQFAVTPKLPAQLTGTLPIIVTKTGLSYNISYSSAVAGSVTRRQMFDAVATLYNMNTLYAAVPMNANDPIWTEFWAGTMVAPGDTLALFIQTTFALTDAQMTTLFALAGTMTP